jgi:hypothetical protein
MEARFSAIADTFNCTCSSLAACFFCGNFKEKTKDQGAMPAIPGSLR